MRPTFDHGRRLRTSRRASKVGELCVTSRQMKTLIIASITLLASCAWAQTWAISAPTTIPTSAGVKSVFVRIVPTGIQIDDVSVVGNQARVKGVAASTDAISTFMRSADDTGVFQRVELTSSLPSRAGYVFDLRTTIVCPPRREKATLDPCAAPVEKPTNFHKCVVNGVTTFQARACVDKPKAR
jgi:hypothetical protein